MILVFFIYFSINVFLYNSEKASAMVWLGNLKVEFLTKIFDYSCLFFNMPIKRKIISYYLAKEVADTSG